MSAQENIKLNEEFIAAWNAHDVDRGLTTLSDDIVWHDVAVPEPLHGKAAVHQYMQNWFTAFPDVKVTVKNRVADEDQVAGELEFSGTYTGSMQMAPGLPSLPSTGKKVTSKGTYFVRVRGGKAVEVATYPDLAGMMRQLGLMPVPGG